MALSPATRRVTKEAQAAGVGTDADAGPSLSASVQDHLGGGLRAYYQTQLNEAVPPALLDLFAAFDLASRRKTPSVEAFRTDLIEALPALRGFAISLAGGVQAEDLVQETLLKAWANQQSFKPGTNLKAWLFTILRNLFYSNLRRRRREVEDVDGAMAAQLIALPNQEPTLMLQDIAFNLRKLPPSQREALIMVGAQGMTYEAAASVLSCQVGTVKSRVSRGRAMLFDLMRMTDRHAA